MYSFDAIQTMSGAQNAIELFADALWKNVDCELRLL